ncbi:1357_t:CDS:2 [Racocetra persica]|uniref:1357_t:CDS:1 n=1 Tax=Racocetra persica TaxID=160502 RepID=A0ACA9R335_9GLOM|nr:1357_t:CDS:2 [Racocetra persica]
MSGMFKNDTTANHKEIALIILTIIYKYPIDVSPQDHVAVYQNTTDVSPQDYINICHNQSSIEE